jgi:Mor family transcriptional regulator
MADVDTTAWPEDLQTMVEIVGLRGTLALCREFAGLRIQFPTPRRLFAPLRDRLIRAQFTGANHRQLGRKYGLSFVHIYRILGERE